MLVLLYVVRSNAYTLVACHFALNLNDFLSFSWVLMLFSRLIYFKSASNCDVLYCMLTRSSSLEVFLILYSDALTVLPKLTLRESGWPADVAALLIWHS